MTRRAAVEPAGVESGWVQDPVGDPGVASAPEGGGSADPVWLPQCGESKASAERDGQVLPGLVPACGLAGNQHFAKFLLVGASGLFVNSLVLWAFAELTALHYLLSAALATQVSTLWNFGLTEGWVFGKRRPSAAS